MEVEEQLQERLQELFTVKSITRVNHDPHPFMVGPQHVRHASEKHSGMLGEATLRAVPCAHPRCNTDYDGHTSVNVLFLSLKKDVTNEEAAGLLEPLKDFLAENKIDGISFVETPEKFRIT
jgi:hypothetical protein